jgi:NAD(P) transhydrogenase subunit beta
LTTAALIVKISGNLPGAVWAGCCWVWSAAVARRLMAKRVEMTKMPELVAFMHSMIGLAAVFIAVAAWPSPGPSASPPRRMADSRRATGWSSFLGAAIGAITFSGSVIAFGKLSGKYKFRLFQGAPVSVRRASTS